MGIKTNAEIIESKSADTELEQKLETLNKQVDAVMTSLDDIHKHINKKVSFDEYANALSECFDDKILSVEQEKGVKYIGGNCLLKVGGFIKKCTAEAELYFCDSEQNWTKVTMSGAVRVSQFSDEAINGELAEIEKEGGLKIEITRPEL